MLGTQHFIVGSLLEPCDSSKSTALMSIISLIISLYIKCSCSVQDGDTMYLKLKSKTICTSCVNQLIICIGKIIQKKNMHR